MMLPPKFSQPFERVAVFFPADFEHQIPRVGLFSVRSLTQPLVNEAGGFKDWICWGFLFLDMSTDM